VTVRVGINGFGRIGQTILRIASAKQTHDIEIVAINDIATIEKLVYSFKKDSIRGDFSGTIDIADDHIIVNGTKIRIFNAADPAAIPWAEADVDVVIDATGKFRSGNDARVHITHGGARKVIISASADTPDAFLVYGANEKTYDPDRHDVISPASCGVNALSVMARVLVDSFGLHSADTTVILAAQGWQKIHDSVSGTSRDDPRLGRSVSQNIIPHPHVVGDLVTTAIPELGPICYSYYVVPTPIGSMASLAGQTARPVTVDEVNQAMKTAASGALNGILGYDADHTVSSDVKGNGVSCLFDPTATQTTPQGGVKVMGWFDGEWGFASRLIDLVRLVVTNKSETSR
jgi:glyceraldehyde 3-phosphate dehydrogenase